MLDNPLTCYASDLEWVMKSPSLVASPVTPDLAALPSTAKVLADLKAEPLNFETHWLKAKRKNLGSYFETLVFYWLDKLPEVTLIATNQQVWEGKRTVGEIDLLFEYDGQIHHWELGVKFYASTGSGEIESEWLGPLKKDNLGRKLDRLYDFQLPLIQNPQTQTLIRDLGLEGRSIISSAFVKGRLFQRGSIEEPQRKSALPARVSSNCQKGNWWPSEQWQNNLPVKYSHFRILEKPRWFSALENDDWQSMVDDKLKSALKRQFQERDIPVLVALARSENGKIEELTRDFFMPEYWEEKPLLT